MSGPTSATFEDSDEDLVQGPVTRNRGKLLENLGSLISLSKRSVTFADSNKRKSRTSTKGGKKRQKRARSPSRSASPPLQKVLHTLSTISEGFEGPSVSRTESSRSSSRKPGSRSRSGSRSHSGSRSRSRSGSGSGCRQNNSPLIFNDFAAKKNNQYTTLNLTNSPLMFNDFAEKANKFAALSLRIRL